VYRNKLSGRLLAPLCVMVLAAAFCVFSASAALATTYYVDSVSGNDNWDGQSPSTAWQTLSKVNATTFQPGDEILFKAGCIWTGRLWPKGSGTSGSPIVIDIYGSGALPIINGDGIEMEAVRLFNQEYWEINNLEVTNTNPAGPGEIRGIAILGEDAGDLDHIYVKDCVIHDVNGKHYTGRDKGKCNAGVLVDVYKGASQIQTRFNDVLIEGCYIYRCDLSGIKSWTDWFAWECSTPYYHTNLVARNNVVEDTGGDGITLHMAIAPLTEYNTAIKCVQRNWYNDKAYAYVAIWPYECDDPVMQYNEAFLTGGGERDGQGFDIDGLCRRAICQYNYSHDNDGGFLLLCEEPSASSCFYNTDAVVRYNISQNDHRRVIEFGGKVEGATLHNNTIYVPADSDDPYIIQDVHWDMDNDNTSYYNNIFYNLGAGGYDLGTGTWVCDYNVFYPGGQSNEPPDAHKLTSDPKLVYPGGARIGLDSCKAYKLWSDSPCRDSGATITGNGGQDFFGNSVPDTSGYTDRGAHEYSEGGVPVAEFSGSPTVGPPTLNVSFTDRSSESPTSWAWDFGDSGTSTAQNPTHQYTSYGDYTVGLTATNANGQDTTTKVDYVRVVDTNSHVGDIALQGEYTGTGKPSNRGYWVIGTVLVLDQFGDYLKDATVDIEWSGCISGTDSGVTDYKGEISFNSPKNQQGGTFTLCVTDITRSGYPYDSNENEETCDSIDNPAAAQPPVAEFSGNPTSGPAPLTVLFTDLSTNSPTSWSWTFGDGGSSQAADPSHEYTTADTYTVSLEACNSAGCDTETKVDYITVSSGEGTCHVGAIDLVGLYKSTGKPSSRGYYADATITVHDQDCQPLAGVTVDITWSGCVSGTDSDVTDENGRVVFSSPVNPDGGTFTCCVDNLTKSGYPYQPGDNHETCDSIQNP